MRNKIMTLDLEGDGLDAEINQKLFPNGNHQDPNTQIWCATIAFKDDNNKLITDTYVAKLPNHTRLVKDEYWTKAYHEDSTKVPKKIVVNNKWLNGCEYEQRIIQMNDEWELIKYLSDSLLTYSYRGYKLYCKGYGKYNYDYLAICNSFNRLRANKPDASDIELDIGIVGCGMINAAKEFPEINSLWQETSKQVKSGNWVPNQEYMNWGVKHNIEDAVQLLNILQKPVAMKNKLDSLNGDF